MSQCLRHIVPCQILSSSEVLWLFFLFFFQFRFQQSTAQCTCTRPMTLTMTDLHWLKKKASIITLCLHLMFPKSA